MKESKKSSSNKIVDVIKTVLVWVASLYVWLLYAYNMIDRSEQAYEANGGFGPMPSGYAIAILAIVLAVLMHKKVLSKDKSISGTIAKAIVVLILVFGLYTQIGYDPTLSKLMTYKQNATKWEFTGQELFDAVNKHRESIGVQKIELEETFCGDLVERWIAVKNPENGHKGLQDWWADKNLKEDPYGEINELYASGRSAERVIEIWTESPGHRIPLEKPEYNVGCTYASEGYGVMIIGEKPVVN